MKLAITGTRAGMSDEQKAWFVSRAADALIEEFHYGDCVGVDAQALYALIELGAGGVLHCHPAQVAPQWKARTYRNAEQLGLIVHPTEDPLVRNTKMVDATDELWAFPKAGNRIGGTWYTIHYAAVTHKLVTIVFPDGCVQQINSQCVNPEHCGPECVGSCQLLFNQED